MILLMFPSPSRGLIYLNQFMEAGKHEKALFPSPLGDLYIYQYKRFRSNCTTSTVSVPSRGLIYLNSLALEIEALKKAYKFPSPLGDLYISIMTGINNRDEATVFPSPLGDLYISIQYHI